MTEEIKGILIKDFKEILVKEFCTDWKEKRLYIELLVNSTPFSNLLNYITNLQKENEELKELNVCVGCKNNPDYKQRNEKAIEYNKKIVEQYLKEDDCEYCDGRYNVAKKNLDILEGGDE